MATPVTIGPVMRVDVARGAFVEWDAELEAIFGYTRDEVLDRNVELIIPPELKALHWRGFNRAVERRRLKNHGKIVRSVAVHKDGRLVPFRAMDILEFGADGKVETVMGVVVRHGPAWKGVLYRVALLPLGLVQRLMPARAT